MGRRKLRFFRDLQRAASFRGRGETVAPWRYWPISDIWWDCDARCDAPKLCGLLRYWRGYEFDSNRAATRSGVFSVTQLSLMLRIA